MSARQRIAVLAFMGLGLALGCSKKEPDLTAEQRAALQMLGEVQKAQEQATPEQLEAQKKALKMLEEMKNEEEQKEAKRAADRAEKQSDKWQKENEGKFN